MARIGSRSDDQLRSHGIGSGLGNASQIPTHAHVDQEAASKPGLTRELIGLGVGTDAAELHVVADRAVALLGHEVVLETEAAEPADRDGLRRQAIAKQIQNRAAKAVESHRTAGRARTTLED